MLSLRVAVAALGRSMPAFDLAFHRYWQHNHPGESLDEYLRRHTFFSRFSSSIALSEQVQSALSDAAQALLMPGTIGSLVGQTLKTLVRELRDHRQEVRVLASCRRLADLLEAEPDQEALSYYAHLLAWDIAQLPANRCATLVVLLDTFEDVGDRTHRDLERLIQRVAWLMPNALFVVTGRNRLQWDDERLEGQLDWVGPRSWPLLAPGVSEDPRQHRIGYLSAQDSEQYLCRRLMVNERPLMDEATRRLIISRSHGLPLYLDLAVMRFLDLYSHHGHAPDPEEFNHDFPALVARTFRDLTGPERQALRAVSLLDSFSVPLASAAAGLAHDAPVLQLIERPFIETDQVAPWPYSLHNLVRSAIREADSTAEDRWSPADWGRAAARTFAALGEEFHAARTAGDRRRLVSCLRQGLRLARDFGLSLGWLGDAAYAYVTAMIWEPVELPAVSDDSRERPTTAEAIDSAPAALAATLTAIARRQRQHREITADALRDVLASGLLPQPLRELPTYFIAECDRDLGHLTLSMDGMRQVADSGGRLALTPAAACCTSHAVSAGSPTSWPRQRASGRKAAGTARSATCGGPRDTSPSLVPPTLTAGTRRKARDSTEKPPCPRRAWPSPPPSRTGPGPTTRSAVRTRCSRAPPCVGRNSRCATPSSSATREGIRPCHIALPPRSPTRKPPG